MQPDAFSLAAEWLHGLVFTSILPIVASIAILFVGLRMLGGRIEPRRGIHIIVGIFLALGASSIARELMPGVGLDRPPPSASEYSVDAAPSIPDPIEPDLDRSPYSRSSL